MIVSRRSVLRDLAMLSAAGAIGRPFRNGSHVASPPAAPSTDLYVIFAGAWILSFERDQLGKQWIRMITPHRRDHLYSFQVTNPKSAAREIPSGSNFTLDVPSWVPKTTSQSLVTDMRNQHEGIIFSNNVSVPDLSHHKNLRSVILPMPSAISTDALLFGGISINLDPTLNQVTNPAYFPTALALIYSGNWGNATLKEATQGDVGAFSQGNPIHLRFGVCRKGHCDIPMPGPTDCYKLGQDETHASKAFNDLIKLLQINPAPNSPPKLSFTRCVAGNAMFTVCKGRDCNLSHDEVGLPDTAPPEGTPQRGGKYPFFAQLHNCASASMIVGA